MGKKSINNIYNYFIDTGVFIDRLKTDLSNSTPEVKSRVEQTKSFFDLLETIQNRKITFQTTSINVAEIFNCGNRQKETVAALVSICGSNDLEIIAFDEKTATYHNSYLEKYLGNQAIKEIKAQVNYPTSSQYANVEDRIRKDMLICSTAKMYGSDIVLTNDNGFAKLCGILDLPVHCFTGNPSDFITNNSGDKIYDFAP
jgi:predicted nucleic acid-binding protein